MQRWACDAFEVLEKGLDDRDYLVGSEFTGADIMVGYTLNMANVFGVSLESFPAVSKYFERLSARPAYLKAMSA
ncbi:MAG: glutathione S-transferase family protein [Candidatus Binatia bacterium]